MKNYTLKVQEIKGEAGDTVTLCFKQPGLKKIKYLAQYLTIQFRINGRRYIRPYSFSSAPIVDATLDVTVKRVPVGIVSKKIFNTIMELIVCLIVKEVNIKFQIVNFCMIFKLYLCH